MGVEFYVWVYDTPPSKKRTTLWWEAWDENTGDSHRVNG